MLIRFLIFLFLLSSLFCSAQDSKRTKIKKGNWISTLSLSEQDVLPFEMTVTKNKKEYVFTIINGDEKIKLSTPLVKGDSLHVPFPFFNSALVFKGTKKSLSGFWYNYNKGGNYKIPFSALRTNSSRFGISSEPSYGAPIAGNWEVTFEPYTNSSYPAVGVFKESEENNVFGTFLTETGDYRYLSGQKSQDSLFLSCLTAHMLFFSRQSYC